MLTPMREAFAGFQKTEVMGVPVLWLPDARFKTFRLSLSVRRPLDQRAAARSLLPHLLLQGTANYPDRPALARQMEMLYGASVSPGTAKIGEVHTLRFSVDCVAGRFLPDHPDQLRDGLALLSEFLVHPRLEGGGFPAPVFERERRQAANDARAVFDDRGAYAAQQALALCCVDEPMAIPEHGGVAAIEAMDRQAPEAARQDFLRCGQLVLCGMGALPGDQVLLDQVQGFLQGLPARAAEALPDAVYREVVTRRGSVERVDLQQSKLVLIFRLPPTTDPDIWMGRSLFTSMLGGGPHSRLFREVREKQSLAYYAQSALDRHKGLLVVHVGLDESAAPAVEAETLRQIAGLESGAFSAEELTTARAGLLSVIMTLTDSIRSHMQFVEDQWNLGLDRTPAQLFKSYQAIEPEQVARSVDGIALDYAYLLAPTAASAADPPTAASAAGPSAGPAAGPTAGPTAGPEGSDA
jgi:predicted Zn-dependent peptidase